MGNLFLSNREMCSNRISEIKYEISRRTRYLSRMQRKIDAQFQVYDTATTPNERVFALRRIAQYEQHMDKMREDVHDLEAVQMKFEQLLNVAVDWDALSNEKIFLDRMKYDLNDARMASVFNETVMDETTNESYRPNTCNDVNEEDKLRIRLMALRRSCNDDKDKKNVSLQSYVSM